MTKSSDLHWLMYLDEAIDDRDQEEHSQCRRESRVDIIDGKIVSSIWQKSLQIGKVAALPANCGSPFSTATGMSFSVTLQV